MRVPLRGSFKGYTKAYRKDSSKRCITKLRPLSVRMLVNTGRQGLYDTFVFGMDIGSGFLVGKLCRDLKVIRRFKQAAFARPFLRPGPRSSRCLKA